MRTDDRPGCHLDNIEAGLLARVAAIDENADFLHLADDKLARTAQRRRRVKTAAAKKIGEIIGKVGDPEPLVVIGRKLRDRRVRTSIVGIVGGIVIGIAKPLWLELGALLNADDHGNLARLLGSEDIIVGLGECNL